MKNKVITCPATKGGLRNICVCSPKKCSGSYNKDGSRKTVRPSLLYQGIAYKAIKANMSETIKFYSVHGAYGYLSNFSSHEIKLDGKKWPTSEHYFQAQKFEQPKLKTKVRKAKTPGEAAKIGRSRKNPLRRDWESVKIDVMRKAVRAKFTQHQDLKKKLLKTGHAYLVEHTTNDRFWGDGGDGKGKNWLGRILMEIREELSK